MLVYVLAVTQILVTDLPNVVDFPEYGMKIYYALPCELAINNRISANVTLNVGVTASLQLFYGCTNVQRLIVNAILHNPSSNQSFSSVFGVVNQPLTITDSTFEVASSARYASSVASYIIAPTVIKVCFIYYSASNSMSAGGVVNWIHGSTASLSMQDLVVDVNITAELYAGGIIACVEDSANFTIITATVTAEIYTNGVSSGVVGTIRTSARSEIKNVIIKGKISARRDEFVAGLVGQAKVGTISQTIYCVVQAEVRGWCKGGVSGQDIGNVAANGRLVVNLDNGTMCECGDGAGICKRLVADG